MQAIAEVGVKSVTSDVIATRGERLALSRTRSSGRDQRPDAFDTEMLGIVEIDAEERMSRRVVFDLNESTPPSRSSTPGTSPAKRPPTRTRGRSSQGCYAGFNRHELPATTPDWVTVDHRPRRHVRAR